MDENEAAKRYAQYIIARAAYYGYSYTGLASQLRMTANTLRHKLQGASEWRESEVRMLTFVLNLTSEEAAALGIFRAIPQVPPQADMDADEAWSEGSDGWPLGEDPAYVPCDGRETT